MIRKMKTFIAIVAMVGLGFGANAQTSSEENNMSATVIEKHLVGNREVSTLEDGEGRKFKTTPIEKGYLKIGQNFQLQDRFAGGVGNGNAEPQEFIIVLCALYPLPCLIIMLTATPAY